MVTLGLSRLADLSIPFPERPCLWGYLGGFVLALGVGTITSPGCVRPCMVTDTPQSPASQSEILKKVIARKAREWHDYVGCDDLHPAASHDEDEQRVYCEECRTVIARLPA